MYVEVFLTIGVILGTVLLYEQEVLNFFTKIKLESAVRFIGGESKEIENLYFLPEGMNNLIRRLIKITLRIDFKYSSHIFIVITIIIMIFSCWLTASIISPLLRFTLVLTFSLLPLLILIARLQKLRVRNSKEGKILVIELLDNYKIHYFNMQHAIEITASTIEEAPNCKRLLFNLSKGINRASNNAEIRTLLDEFKYAVGTSWAGVLSDNIYFALSSGFRVDNAMEDLIRSISMAEEVEERAKRENNEAGLILKYLVPISYFMTYVGAIKVFGLTPREFMHYQFETETGISWFAAIAVMYIMSLVVKFFLTQNKLDL